MLEDPPDGLDERDRQVIQDVTKWPTSYWPKGRWKRGRTGSGNVWKP